MLFRRNQPAARSLRSGSCNKQRTHCVTRGRFLPHTHCAILLSASSPREGWGETRPLFLGSVLKMYQCWASASSSKPGCLRVDFPLSSHQPPQTQCGSHVSPQLPWWKFLLFLSCPIAWSCCTFWSSLWKGRATTIPHASGVL